MPQFSVQVNLIVKAASQEEATSIVRQRLATPLNGWFCEGTDRPVYPDGSLLYWSVFSPSPPFSAPAPAAGPIAPSGNATRAVSGSANPLPAGPAAPAPAPKGWTEVG